MFFFEKMGKNKILIVNHHGIGDNLMMTPAVRAVSATMSPTSPRGVIPQPTARDSCFVIFPSRAGTAQPTSGQPAGSYTGTVVLTVIVL